MVVLGFDWVIGRVVRRGSVNVMGEVIGSEWDHSRGGRDYTALSVAQDACRSRRSHRAADATSVGRCRCSALIVVV